MADSAIVRIPVDDSAFKRFLATWDAYQEQLKGQGKAWAESNTQVRKFGDGASEAFSSTAEGLAAVTVALSAVARREADAEVSMRRSNNVLRDTLKLTGGILSNVTGVALQLARWALLGGLAGFATGMLGAGALASQASGLRSTSRAYGVRPGQLQAAEAVFGPLGVDANALLGGIAQMQLTNPGAAARLGILNANPGDALPQLLRGAVATYRQGGPFGGAALLEAQGYTGMGLDPALVRSLSRLPAGELEQQLGRYQTESRRLDIDDPTLKAWQGLRQTLNEAEKTIDSALIKSLAPLAPTLSELSETIAGDIEALSQSGQLKEWIEDLGDGIHAFAKYLGSDELKSDMADFRKLVHGLAHPLESTGNAYNDLVTNPLSRGLGGFAADLGESMHDVDTDRRVLNDAAFRAKYGYGKNEVPAGIRAKPSVGPVSSSTILPAYGATADELTRRATAAGLAPDYWRKADMKEGGWQSKVTVNIMNKPGTDVTAQVTQLPSN